MRTGGGLAGMVLVLRLVSQGRWRAVFQPQMGGRHSLNAELKLLTS